MKRIAAGVALFVVALPLAIILLLGGAAQCGGNGDVPAPSAAAANGIPANYLQLYMAAGRKYGVQWNLLAGVGSIESDHGRLKAAGVTSGTNSAGAAGPMQFLEGTWQAYGVDGNHDGHKNKYDPRDAIPGAAKLLKASGAPGDLHSAIFAYNHAEWYVQKVLAKMREYAASGGPSASSGRSASSRAAAAPKDTGDVLNLGDSLAVGSGPPLENALSKLSVRTLAAKNRTSSQGLAVLRTVGLVPSTLVVQLGTNDTSVGTFRANVRSVLAIARRASSTVLWVNIARPRLGGTTDTQLNAVLRDEAASHDNLRVVDWHAAVKSGQVDLADGVHPTAAGYAKRAQLIATVVSGTTGPAADAGAAGDCADGGGATGSGNGKFTIADGANLPGKPLSAEMTAFITRMATFYDGTLVVTTGTNHDKYTTSGNVSDHFTGNGADFGMVANHGTNDGPVGDRIAASAFLAAGLPRDEAIKRAQAGGAQTLVSNGLRIQIIWKTNVGGNHHNHVHVGVKRI